jgi:MFS family permease
MALTLGMWAVSTGLWALGVFAFAYGVIYGGWVALLPALVTDYFGGRNVSGIIGILFSSVAVGTLVGPTAVGFAFDMSHSYTVPILVGACANVLAAAVMATTSSEPPRGQSIIPGERALPYLGSSNEGNQAVQEPCRPSSSVPSLPLSRVRPAAEETRRP